LQNLIQYVETFLVKLLILECKYVVVQIGERIFN